MFKKKEDNKTIIAIIGKTSSGKDTISRHITEKYNIPFVVSYTTRPKRDYETNGKEHYFISAKKMAKLCRNKSDLMAYTKNAQTGIEYCATKSSIKGDKALYIINPDGVDWLKQNCPDVRVVAIYIALEEEDILKRGIARGDNESTLRTRLASEREEFDEYRRSGKWNYVVDSGKRLDMVLADVDMIMSEVL